MLLTYIALLSLLRPPFTHGESEIPRPVCLQPSGRLGNLHKTASYRQANDGRILALCYNDGNLAIDDNWITDVGAILSTFIDSKGEKRCVDCKPTAEANGCTGKSTIWNMNNEHWLEGFGADKPPPLDDISRDVFLDVLRDVRNQGGKIGWGDGGIDGPIMTIDTVGENGRASREQEFTIFGNEATCQDRIFDK